LPANCSAFFSSCVTLTLSFLANPCRKTLRSRIRPEGTVRYPPLLPLQGRATSVTGGSAAAVTSAVAQRETFVRSDYLSQLLEPPHPFLNAVPTRERLVHQAFFVGFAF